MLLAESIWHTWRCSQYQGKSHPKCSQLGCRWLSKCMSEHPQIGWPWILQLTQCSILYPQGNCQKDLPLRILSPTNQWSHCHLHPWRRWSSRRSSDKWQKRTDSSQPKRKGHPFQWVPYQNNGQNSYWCKRHHLGRRRWWSSRNGMRLQPGERHCTGSQRKRLWKT